ncbi:hypothetical protein [Bacillus thuringiensis]|uniref:hypothetical protein n=1 Tax=Bacillus thuringiensis TaxID=1428 RepID=UPI000BFB7F3F|nr:hypothetical protein [Bacillus thuringiensis]PGT89812.1 hypothetical protein COD17_08675 [Bacillus thuringiensis]
MVRVKVINSEMLDRGVEFEDVVNGACETIEANGNEVTDIKYQMTYTPPDPDVSSSSEQVHTALIMYKRKDS